MGADVDFDSEVFDMLRAAVNLARHEQLRTAARLRERLAEVYPQVPSETIASALQLWAEYARKTYPECGSNLALP